MHSTFVACLFVLLCCSASAVPCRRWNLDRNRDMIVTHTVPVQEEIILLTFVEGDDDGSAVAPAENLVQSDNIPVSEDSDDKQSAEIVDSAANKGLPAVGKSDPLPTSKTHEVPQQTANTTEALPEEVALTTERGLETE